MKNAEKIVVEWGHSGDETSTAGQRIERYRALAATTARPSIAGHFFHCADRLEAAEKSIGQLALDFGRANPESNGGAKS